ncbi:MAG: hypothetical protein P8R54_16575 [Myxococcota bacterium]|nr:hypothetical protein [Myxococcota bacterium]
MIPLLFLGCGDDAPEGLLSACDGDADCEIAAAVAAWPAEPDTVLAAINDHALPEARIAIVGHILQAHPQGSERLCPSLPEGAARDRCAQLSGRPHLWQAVRPAQPLAPRAGGGPSSTEIAPVLGVKTRWTGLSAADDPCTEDADHTGCLIASALEAVGRRQAQQSAALCLNIHEERWQGECMFLSAEAAVRRWGPHGYGDAVELCIAAEPFSQNCHSHSLMLMADLAPSAADGQPGAWGDVILAATAVRTAWSWRDPQMAALAGDRLWSEVTGRAYAGAHEVNGNPLAALPEAAHPHVRAAAVRRLVDMEGAEAHDLTGWVNRAEHALAARSRAAARRSDATFRAAADLWPLDRSGEETIPAIAYLGTGRRTVSTDPTIDLTLCVLEAIGRSPPVPASIMEQGAAHPDPLTAWTAARLVELRSPEE